MVVISGETEEALPEVAVELLGGGPPTEMAGVHRQTNLSVELDDARLANTPLVDLERLPEPDHCDYFAQLAACGLEGERQRITRFAASRGCWWAARSGSCLFCSLQGRLPGYRAISAVKVVRELACATRAHGADLAMASDSTFDTARLDDLVPLLAQTDLPVSIFHEVRPCLTREQLRQLERAGINHFQAGIESFSTPLLQKINKGTTGIENVQFLKWAEELGLYVSWNLICGLPHATSGDYQTSLDLLPQLSHLSPTAYVIDFVLQRHSPYYQRREEFFTRVDPLPAYDEIYHGLGREVVQRLAYNFIGDHAGVENAGVYKQLLTRALERWKEDHRQAGLYYHHHRGAGCPRMLVVDTRPVARRLCTTLTGLACQLYAACDGAVSLGRLYRIAGEWRQGGKHTRAEVQQTLSELVERRLMLQEGTRYLSLALPLECCKRDDRWQAWADGISESPEARPVLELLGHRRG